MLLYRCPVDDSVTFTESGDARIQRFSLAAFAFKGDNWLVCTSTVERLRKTNVNAYVNANIFKIHIQPGLSGATSIVFTSINSMFNMFKGS